MPVVGTRGKPSCSRRSSIDARRRSSTTVSRSVLRIIFERPGRTHSPALPELVASLPAHASARSNALARDKEPAASPTSDRSAASADVGEDGGGSGRRSTSAGGTAKGVTGRGGGAERGAGAGSSSQLPRSPSLVASLERTFLSLASAFGETIEPLDRGASLQEREATWRGRIALFETLMRQQQVSLGCRARV